MELQASSVHMESVPQLSRMGITLMSQFEAVMRSEKADPYWDETFYVRMGAFCVSCCEK